VSGGGGFIFRGPTFNDVNKDDQGTRRSGAPLSGFGLQACRYVENLKEFVARI
jgi:hypothetical protein